MFQAHNNQKQNRLCAPVYSPINPTASLLYSQAPNPQYIPNRNCRNTVLLRCKYSESVKGTTLETSNQGRGNYHDNYQPEPSLHVSQMHALILQPNLTKFQMLKFPSLGTFYSKDLNHSKRCQHKMMQYLTHRGPFLEVAIALCQSNRLLIDATHHSIDIVP